MQESLTSIMWKLWLRLLRVLPRQLQSNYLTRVYKRYLVSQIARDWHQQLLRNTAVATGSQALDTAHAKALESRLILPYVESETQVKQGLVKLGEGEKSQIHDRLIASGFYLFSSQIASAQTATFLSDALAEAARSQPSLARWLSSLDDPLRPEMLSLATEWTLRQDLTAALATDATILSAVGHYLGAEPVISSVESWFSLPVQKLRPGSAQQWHWDCDRVRWIKLFLFITEVTDSNGPHSYVLGSHRGWSLKAPDSRFSDEEVAAAYDEDQIRTFTGPTGTVLLEDTRGLHRGTPVKRGFRLVLQIEFSTDTFGRIEPIRQVPDTFREACSQFPRLLSGHFR